MYTVPGTTNTGAPKIKTGGLAFMSNNRVAISAVTESTSKKLHRIITVNDHDLLFGKNKDIYSPLTTGDELITDYEMLYGSRIAVTPDGRKMFAADTSNHAIHEINMQTGNAALLAGQISVTPTVFNRPYGLAVKNDGSKLEEYVVVVADTFSHTIQAVNTDTKKVTTLAGVKDSLGTADGVGTDARFHRPFDVALVPGGANLAYVADTNSHKIRELNLDTMQVRTLAGTHEYPGAHQDGMGTNARFNQPSGVTVTPDGEFVVVADTYNYVIRLIDRYSAQVSTLAGSPGVQGSALGIGASAKFMKPWSVLVTSDGSSIIMTDKDAGDVKIIHMPDTCACNQYFEGPMGGPCATCPGRTICPQQLALPPQATTSKPPAPAPTTTSPAPATTPPPLPPMFEVKTSFSLAMAKDSFTGEKQRQFKSALAKAVGVGESQVSIDKIDDDNTAPVRRLLAQRTKVDTTVKVICT